MSEASDFAAGQTDPRRRAGHFPVVRRPRRHARPRLRPHWRSGISWKPWLLPDGSVSLHFRLPARMNFEVGLHRHRRRARSRWNSPSPTPATADFAFETCLHTYFQIGDIDAIADHRPARHALSRSRSPTPTAPKPRTPSAFTGEMDRVYQDTTATVEIHDPGFSRKIRVRKVRLQLHRRLESMDRKIQAHARLRRRRIPAHGLRGIRQRRHKPNHPPARRPRP